MGEFAGGIISEFWLVVKRNLTSDMAKGRRIMQPGFKFDTLQERGLFPAGVFWFLEDESKYRSSTSSFYSFT